MSKLLFQEAGHSCFDNSRRNLKNLQRLQAAGAPRSDCTSKWSCVRGACAALMTSSPAQHVTSPHPAPRKRQLPV